MKLLKELNSIINEDIAKALDVNGFNIQLTAWDAIHYYYAGGERYRGRFEPNDSYDDSTAYILIDSLTFNLKGKNDSYKVFYDLSKYPYNDFKDDLAIMSQLKSDMVEVHDDNDDQINDMKTLAGIKNNIIEYVRKFDIFEFLTNNAKQEETEPEQPDYNDDF